MVRKWSDFSDDRRRPDGQSASPRFPPSGTGKRRAAHEIRIIAVGYSLARTGRRFKFRGLFDQPTETSDNRVAMAFAQFPEINVSQMARRMGINETLLAKYICGYSKPSEKRAKEIEAALHDLGHKLTQISI